MARRIVMGRFSSSRWDCVITKPGYDALTVDVNDREKCAFAASSGNHMIIATAGQISGLDSFVSFGYTYSNPPPIMFAIKRGGSFYTDVPGYWIDAGTEGSPAVYGNVYCAVVRADRIAATIALSAYWKSELTIPFSGTDKFVWYGAE